MQVLAPGRDHHVSPSVPARTSARILLILARSVDWLPQPVKIARRHAFRYVRIEVVAVSMHYGVRWVDHSYAILPASG